MIMLRFASLLLSLLVWSVAPALVAAERHRSSIVKGFKKKTIDWETLDVARHLRRLATGAEEYEEETQMPKGKGDSASVEGVPKMGGKGKGKSSHAPSMMGKEEPSGKGYSSSTPGKNKGTKAPGYPSKGGKGETEEKSKGGNKTKSAKKTSKKQNNDDNHEDSETESGGSTAPPEGPALVPEGPISGNEVSFVVLLDEFAYSEFPITMGTKFAYKGRLMTNDLHVGSSTGSCTVFEATNMEDSMCDLFLTFTTDGATGVGTVSLSGGTNVDGGYLQVTGTGEDLASSQTGNARISFDPAGNPVLYVFLVLD